jgi:hypothetical protein
MLHTQTTTKGFNLFHKILVIKRDKFYPQVVKIWGSHLHKVQGYAGSRNEYAQNPGVSSEGRESKIHNSKTMTPKISKFW